MSDQYHYRYENPRCALAVEHYAYRIGSYHFNWHTDLELLCVIAGSIELSVNGERLLLSGDDLVLINPNEGHATLGLDADATAMVLHIDPVFFKGYFEEAERTAIELRSVGSHRGDERFRALRASLARLMDLGLEATGPDIRYDAELYRLATCLAAFPRMQLPAAAYKAGAEAGSMAQLVRYIDMRFRERITLEDLAHMSGYNPTYISQLFKNELSINFSEYLTRVRLAQATSMLSAGDCRIADAAAMAGFPDVRSFGLAFKRTFGVTPKEYRKMVSDDARVNDADFKLNFIALDDEGVCSVLARYREGESAACIAPGSAPDAADALRAALDAVRRQLDEAVHLLETS